MPSTIAPGRPPISALSPQHGRGPVAGGRLFGRRESSELQEWIPGQSARFGYGNHLVALFTGIRGTGKTALMTALLARQKEAYRRRGYNGKLFANYEVKFFDKSRDYWSPWFMEEMATFPPYFAHGIAAIDEAQGVILGRRSMSKTNVNMSAFLTQMRHRDIEMMFTTQFPQVLDYQALIQTNLFIKLRTIQRQKGGPFAGFPILIQMQISDYWGQFTGKDWRKPWPIQRQDVDVIRMIRLDPIIGSMYDTNEIIASAYWSEGVRERVIEEESDKHEVDMDWLNTLRPAVQEAQEFRSDKRRAAEAATSLDSLLDVIPKDGQPFNVNAAVKAVTAATNGKLSTGKAIQDELAKAGFETWVWIAPSGIPQHMVKWTAKGAA
jgi:hypothetical protein